MSGGGAAPSKGFSRGVEIAKVTCRPVALVRLVDRARGGEDEGGGALSEREVEEAFRLRKGVLVMPRSGLRRLNTARDPVSSLPLHPGVQLTGVQERSNASSSPAGIGCPATRARLWTAQEARLVVQSQQVASSRTRRSVPGVLESSDQGSRKEETFVSSGLSRKVQAPPPLLNVDPSQATIHSSLNWQASWG